MKKTHQRLKQFLAFCLLILIGLTAFSQTKSNFPTIGKPMPDFTLNDLNYHAKKKISSADLKGKWYILDFWIRSCAPCIASFPKVSKMAQEFKGKVEIIEVGVGGNQEMRAFYEGLRKKQELAMAVAYDNKLAEQWQIGYYPHIYIVDDKGILRVITSDMSSEQLKSLMEGKDTFVNIQDKEYLPNDASKLYFRDNNGGNDTTYLIRSILAKASPDYSPNGDANFNTIAPPGYGDNVMWRTRMNLKKGMFQISKTPLITLYYAAYFGQDRTWDTDSLYKEAILVTSYNKNGGMYPILELKDSSDFKPDFKTLHGLYTYSLSMPKEKATREAMMRSMRLDLFRQFGYDARIETRKMPVWKLVVSDKALAEKLRTKGGDPATGIYEPAKWHFVNAPHQVIIQRLWSKYQFETAFLDETGIDYNIDINIECSFKDLDCVKAELLKNGLDLIKTQKDMKVLVIRDPSQAIKF